MPDFRNADEPDCLQADEAGALLKAGNLILCQRRVHAVAPVFERMVAEDEGGTGAFIRSITRFRRHRVLLARAGLRALLFVLEPTWPILSRLALSWQPCALDGLLERGRNLEPDRFAGFYLHGLTRARIECLARLCLDDSEGPKAGEGEAAGLL